MSKLLSPSSECHDSLNQEPTRDVEVLLINSAQSTIDHELFRIDQDSGEVDKIQAAKNKIVKIKEILVDTVDNGTGIDENASKITLIAVESLRKTLNLPRSQSLLPAIENFENKSTRVIATKVATESILSYVKSALQTIIDMIVRIWDRITKFFKSLFSFKTLSEQRVKQAQKSISELSPDAQPTQPFLEAVGLESVNIHQAVHGNVIRFNIKDRCDFETVSTIIDHTERMITSHREIVLHIVSTMNELLADKIHYDRVVDQVERLVGEIKSKTTHFPMHTKEYLGNIAIATYGNFYDEHVFVVKEQAGKRYADDHVRLFNLDAGFEKQCSEKSYRPKVLSKSEMDKIAKDTVDLNNKSSALDKVIPIVDKVLKKARDSFMESIRHDHGLMITLEADAEASRRTHAILELIKDLFRYVTNTLPKLSAEVMKINNGISVYIKSSIKLYA